MHVAHVVHRYLPGLLTGSAVYMQKLSEGLNERTNTVSVVTSNALDGVALTNPWSGSLSMRSFEKINGVNTYRFPIDYHVQASCKFFNGVLEKYIPGFKFDIARLFALRPFMLRMYFYLASNQGAYDLVHATPFPFVHTWLAAKACQKSKTPFVVTPFFHINMMEYYNQELIAVLRNADAVFACTDIERNVLINLGVHREKIKIVPMGINEKEFDGCSGERFRNKFDLDGKFLILFAGSKSYDKGAVHVLNVVEKLAEKRNDVVLVAMGSDTVEWTSAVRGTRKKSFLLDLPYTSGVEKADVFDACDVLVMPSRADAFGIVYLEAWCRGKPVIGAKCGGVPAVISDGVDGFLVKFGDLGDIKARINLLINSPALAEKLGGMGRKKVIANYTWPTIVDDVERIYEEIIAQKIEIGVEQNF
jgi:glycosyltransferase involved in cell wall biosynthesis